MNTSEDIEKLEKSEKALRYRKLFREWFPIALSVVAIIVALIVGLSRYF